MEEIKRVPTKSHESDDDDSVESACSEVEVLSSEDAGVEMKQHALAVLIAMMATFVSYSHLSAGANISSQTKLSSHPIKMAHHAGYRRTTGIHFCEEDEIRILEQMKPSNGNIRTFKFDFPSDLKPAMISYFEKDDDAEKDIIDQYPEFHRNSTFTIDPNIRCIQAKGGINTFGTAFGFKSPDISTFYKLSPPKGHLSGKSIVQARPSFTGFAAKFYNLSPNTMVLWWDGGSGNRRKRRKIAEVGPFESVGTSTHNGQSFSFTPTYDKDHDVVRFLVTEDEAVSVYDAIKDAEANGKKIKLTNEQRKLYDGQLLNLVYGRSYLVETGRHWLSSFPRPPPSYHMYTSEYFGQKHAIETKQTHFLTMPPQNELGRLAIDAHHLHPSVSLKEYRDNEQESLKLILKSVSCSPRVFEIDSFLSPVEVQHIMDLASNLEFSESMTNSHATLRGEEDRKTRSSTNTWVDRGSSPILDAIYRRAADVLQIDESLLRHREGFEHTELATDHSIAEAIQLVHYAEGEQYTAHHDTIHPSMQDRYQPYRFATILFYLNDGMEGGETTFPRSVTADSHSGIEIFPKKGKAVLFYNMLEDGNVDDLSQHASTEVLKGEKWVANLWVWDPIIN